MKKMQFYFVALLAMSFAMFSCSDDDNQNFAAGNQPSVQTQSAFERDYPGATDVRWAKKRGYDVAYFNLPVSRAAAQNEQHSAWYNAQAKRSYAKYELSLEELKQEAPAVVDAWEASTYKAEGYELDDIDKKEYDNGMEPTYKLEVEKGDIEYELEYAADGTLLSAKQDIDSADEDEEDEPAPQEILDFFTTNFPEAQILEVDLEDDDEEGQKPYYEVEISYRRDGEVIEADVIFTPDHEFKAIVEEIDDDDYTNTEVLPEAVYAKAQELAQDAELDEILKIYTSIDAFKNNADPVYCVVIEREDAQGEETEEYFMMDKEAQIIR